MYNPNRSTRKRKHRDRAPQQSRQREQESEPAVWNYNNFKGPSTSSDGIADGEAFHDPLRSLYIEAHEASVLRGPQAEAAAESLEVVEYYQVTETEDTSGSAGTRRTRVRAKDAQSMESTGATRVLIQLHSGIEPHDARNRLGATSLKKHLQDDSGLSIVDMDDADPASPHVNGTGTSRSAATGAIWVDRYDIRLLLDALPSGLPYASSSNLLLGSTPAIRPSSPSGWSDLSSDAEDTFFFTSEETEDFRRDKRRRLIEKVREERLRQRQEEDGDDDEGNDDPHDAWGGSDEEPDEKQGLLMKRTATHLVGCPNPAQLEMRILANHGADPRFAFLLPRGRWRRAWAASKDEARREKEKEQKAKETKSMLGGLASYGSGSGTDGTDDEGSEDGDKGTTTEAKVSQPQPPSSPPPLPPSAPPSVPPPPPLASTSADGLDENAVKAARRQRAKEWAEKRRAMASASEGDVDGR